MKIAFIDYRLPELIKNENYPIGGWPVELMGWLQGLKNHDVTTFLLTDQKSASTLKFNLCTLIGSHDPNYKGIKYLKYFYYILPRLYLSIKRLNPDFFIQGCASLDTGLLAVICKILNIPFIYRVVSDLDVTYKSPSLKKYESIAFRMGMRLATGFVCQNQFQYDALIGKYPKKAIIKLYNPYVIKEYDKSRLIGKREYFAWVGNFRWQKNLHLLFELAELLPNVKFKVAGQATVSTDKQSHEAYKKLLKLSNVEFLGHVNNNKILDLLQSAIALLNTSDVEGFSNTYLEAFSVGTPVLTRTLADPDNIIMKNSLGSAAENRDGLMAAVREYQDMPSLDYQKKSVDCFNYVLHNHDPVKLSQELISFLQNIANQSK